MPSFTIQTETLLAHEPFIRSVARAVLHDEDAAQDVVQETWIRAMQPASRPVENLRAWLGTVARNIAMGQRRSGGHRAAREEDVARPERFEDTDPSETLELQGEVIRAVLALREPYRTAILKRHFEEQGFPEIARATGVKESTVRSRVSRAHAMLRDELDRHCDRHAWMLLAGLPGVPSAPAKGAVLSAKVMVFGGGVLAAGAAAVLAVSLRSDGKGAQMQPESRLAHVDAQRNDAGPVRRLDAPDASAPRGKDPADLAPIPTGGSAPVNAVPPPAVKRPSGAELRATMEQRLERVVWLGRAIRERLLTPDPTAALHHEALLAQEHTGVCRLIDRRIAREKGLESTIFVRGGGAYYSFATLDHSYNSEPDIELSQWLDSGFYGGVWGLVVPLGQASIADLRASADAVPPQLDELGREAWNIVWSKHETRPTLSIPMITAARYRLPAKGEAYLVRSSSKDEHDHLVAVEIESVDAYGCTLVWRRLAQWDVPGTRARRAPVENYADTRQADDAFVREVSSKSIDQLFDLMEAERARARRDILFGDQVETAGHRGAKGAAEFVRLMHPSRFDPLFGVAGYSSSFSFATHRHGKENADSPPLVELRLSKLLSKVTGSERGSFLALGTITEQQFTDTDRDSLPRQTTLDGVAGGAAIRSPTEELWDLLCASNPSRRSIRQALQSESHPALETTVPMYLGHAYLFRAKPYGADEPPTLIRVVGWDEHGASLTWRTID